MSQQYSMIKLDTNTLRTNYPSPSPPVSPILHICCASGALFGLCKGIVLVEVLLILVSVFPVSSQLILAIEDSIVASFLLEQFAIVEQILPTEFEEAFEKLKLNLEQLQ